MSGDNILVAVKSRPFISRENREKLNSQWNIQEKSIYQIDENLHRIGEPYSFDYVFTEENTNADVYDAVVEPLIRSCFEGFNSTIFAYGQTSSGKTYTMMGNKNTPGLIQLAVNDIFKQVQQDKQRRYLISCSYFEIYNEKIKNLLDKNESDLKIREDYDGNTFLIAKEEVVTVPEQVFELMNIGNKTRKIGCTNMNERSSRSHTIFRFSIESTDNSIENGPVQVSQLNLVDLAGSERVALAKAEGKRLQEGVNINKSLTVLGYVIRQLSDGERHISYRDSKLTRLLQQALGGNAKALIVATITLAAGEETKSTLEFAQRAKAVKNKPIINEILSESDKLKKHELITAAYKERLDIEKQRMQEMEIRFQQEKIESQKEIAKLKEQCKLIDLFAKGPQGCKPDNKIFRRHTVGYYGSVAVLEPIPELTVAPSTSYTRGKGSTRKPISTVVLGDFDEEILNIEETSDSVLAEPMDESLRSTRTPSPEPSQYESIVQQGGETPPSFLRKRIKSLEESYTSLKEFTKLESECNEKDKDSLEELVKERENLLKDLNDLNAMYQSERQEKETLKLMYTETEASLKAQLDNEMKKNSRLSFRLAQIEAENDLLKVARRQELTEKMNQQFESDKTQVERLQHKIDELEGKNRQLSENVTVKEAEIHHLEEELSKREEMHEEAVMDVLSTATQTEIKIEDDKEKLMQLEEEIVNLRKENDVLKQMEEELIKKRTENDVLKQTQEQLTQMRQDNNALKKQIKSVQLSKDTEVKSLQEKIRELETDNENYGQRMMEEEQQLCLQLTEAQAVIKQLNEKLVLEGERCASLSEEKDTSLRDVGVLTELLSLGNEETVRGLFEEHQGLLDLFQAQLKSYSEQIATDCSMEMDLFVACLLDLKDFATDPLIHEQIEMILVNISDSAANFIYLLEDILKSLVSANSHKYSDSVDKLNNLKSQVKEKVNYVTYMELHNKQLQTKIYKQMQYLDQLNEVGQRISADKRKDQTIEDLQCKIKDLSRQITTGTEQFEKKIFELELTVSDLRLKCDVLKREIEERNASEESDFKNSNADLEKTIELNDEILALKTEIITLRAERDEIANDLERLKKSLDDVEAEMETEKTKNQELNRKIEDLYLENVSLITKNFDLEHQLKDLKSQGGFGLRTFPVNGDDGKITDPTKENTTLKIEVEKLRSTITDLCSERDELVGQLASMKESVEQFESDAAVQTEKTKNMELNKKSKDLYLENMSLITRINDLENTLKVTKSSDSLESPRSSTELSPREMRRRKRQSLQDQRRGISVQECGNVLSEDDKISTLMAQVKELTGENAFLESEVQGFMEVVKDYERYNKEQANEIEELKEKLNKQMYQGREKKNCDTCETKEDYIKKLENLHKAFSFRKVDLQTKIYDLLNSADMEKNKRDEVERMLRFENSQLKEKLRMGQPADVEHSEVQCDLLDYDTLIAKYANMKKLAIMRRDEANVLRARLGMKPDEPVQ